MLPVPEPASGAVDDPSPGDYRAAVWFYPDDLRRLVPPRTVRRNFERGAAEDPLLWHVVRGLAGDRDLPYQRLNNPIAAPEQLPLVGAGLALWNRSVPGCEIDGRVLKALYRTIARFEPQVKRHSELDAVLYDPARRELAIVEAKLKAPPGRCAAVAPGGSGCRMYRRLLDPKWNGCTYWGIGEGGPAFTAQFPDRLVERYFAFAPPSRERPAGAECDRYYQLMRAWLIGCETVRALAPGHRFHLVSITPARRAQNGYYRDFAERIRSDAHDLVQVRASFGVTSWETIRDGLPPGHPVRVYLEKFRAVTRPGTR